MQQNQLTKEETMVLISAKHQEKGALWALIRMSLETYASVAQAAQDHQPLNLSTLGEVVDTGWGDLPEEDVLQAMYARYGDIEKIRSDVVSALNTE